MRASFGRPPARVPVPVTDVPTVRGKRVILSHAEYGFIYDMRATSEVEQYADGPYVRVISEAKWYAWLAEDETTRAPQGPRGAVAWAASLVYVE